MEPITTSEQRATIFAEGRAKAADEKIAKLSELLHRLEEAAQNDGLATTPSTDSYQSQLVKVRLGVASSLFTAMRAKHPATANHCFRVALGISAWSAARKMVEDQRDIIEIAALLHDVGKIGVPDSILAKPGKLSAEELLSIERSRLVGYEILSGCCATSLIHETMLFAGGWFDGSKHGYDRRGEHLPIGSRMIAIVDAFDSMTTEHVYRPAVSRELALAELCKYAGTQFDPQLVKEFCDLITRESGQIHAKVARRWLRDLSPDHSDAHWTLRQSRVALTGNHGNGEFQERLLDTMSDGVVFVDSELKVLRWNAAAERLTGIPADGIVDTVWSPGLVRMRDERGRLLEVRDCPALQSLQTGVQTLRRYSLMNRRNERVTLDLMVFPVLGENGSPRGAGLVLHDASSQMSLEKRIESLHERASRDQLTKAANRAEFNRVLPEFIETHLKEGRPCTMMMCDIDHFKKINDTYGHQAGDDALVLFSSVLLRHARTGDLVARYGGEEFVLLCADCDNAAATRRAEEIRRRVSETQMISLNNKCLTASFGVTEIQGGDTPETFLNRADRALLQAKEAGRNMVVQLGTGIGAEQNAHESTGWFRWFGVPAGEILLERTLISAVPLKVTAEKLRGFVADHHAQLGRVDDNCVTLTIDSQSIPLLRRVTDRPVPFQIELKLDEKQLPIDGRVNQVALRTLIHVTIRPKRQRDRRRRDAIERARQLLFSLQSYLIAQDYLDGKEPSAKDVRREGLLESSKRLLSHWLRK